MKKLLLLILPFLLIACGDDKDEPRPAKLDGCYYLSHTKIETRTPVGDGFYNTSVREEDHHLFFGAGSYAEDMMENIPCSIYFDKNVVYWFCTTLPSHPSQNDYPDDVTGLYEYMSAVDDWEHLCEWEMPGDYYTSTYKVTNGSLYIGKADMGKIVIEPDKFKLEYTYTNPAGQILKKIFTYTYYPSFNKGDI